MVFLTGGLSWPLLKRADLCGAFTHGCRVRPQRISSITCPLCSSTMQGQCPKQIRLIVDVIIAYLSLVVKRRPELSLPVPPRVEGIDKSWEPILGSFEDLAGDPAEGEWGGILLFTGTDLEYVCNELGMSHYNSKEMCGYCDANDSDVPHTDNSDGARWRPTCRHNLAFLGKFRLPLHPLVAHKIFTVYTYRLDIMHLLDHHGVTSHIVGNTMIVHEKDRGGILPGSNIEERLAFLNNDLKAYYSYSGCRNRLPPLRETNLMGDSGFPELRGQLVKAANTRSVVPYLLELQRRACRANNSPRNRRIFKVIESLQTLYDTFYGASYFLSTAEKSTVYKHCNRLGQLYQVLAVDATREGKLLWKQQPELHYVVGHLADQARLINPRVVQGYTSESMVGSMAGIHKKSMDGPHHRHVQGRFAKKILPLFAP